MKLISDLLSHRSLAIVGLEKNTGKTECLNYVLRNLPSGDGVAVTSIGTDGERVDAVRRSRKPEIALREGMVFGTSEKYYAGRKLSAEVLDVGLHATAVGRVVTARALSGGKVMLSGPPSTAALRRWMDSLGGFGVKLTIVDGALSRMSSASPAVTEAMILSTGAAFSADMNTLVRETAYRVELIGLPLAPPDVISALRGADQGLWRIDESGALHPLSDGTPLRADNIVGSMSRGDTLYVAGALTPRLLNMIVAGNASPGGEDAALRVIVGDFTKIFLPSADYRTFAARGGRIEVLRRSELLAVCVNPVAPNGMALDRELLLASMSEAVDVPVYDIFTI